MPSVEQGTEVFRALADPTRRALLDRLFSQDGQTLNELCQNFPEMTRFGVMKHLSVLAEADLVLTARQGRSGTISILCPSSKLPTGGSASMRLDSPQPWSHWTTR
jgi:DNA-binding transcriptional ArsR family regulator